MIIFERIKPTEMETTDETGIVQGGHRGGGTFNNIDDIAQTNNEFATTEMDKQYEEMEAKQTAELQDIRDREDFLRKETQEREDTRYQRLVDDMIKAGINPNLFMGTPVSGGGLTTATGKDTTQSENVKNRTLNKLMQDIQLAFTGDQNAKDRTIKWFDSITRVLQKQEEIGIKGAEIGTKFIK